MTAITRIAFALQDAPAAVETHSIMPPRTRGVYLRITVAIDVTLRNVSTRDARDGLSVGLTGLQDMYNPINVIFSNYVDLPGMRMRNLDFFRFDLERATSETSYTRNGVRACNSVRF